MRESEEYLTDLNDNPIELLKKIRDTGRACFWDLFRVGHSKYTPYKYEPFMEIRQRILLCARDDEKSVELTDEELKIIDQFYYDLLLKNNS